MKPIQKSVVYFNNTQKAPPETDEVISRLKVNLGKPVSDFRVRKMEKAQDGGNLSTR